MDDSYSVKNKNLIKNAVLVLLILLACFPLFRNLGATQIKLWDEATYANNSIDMLRDDANILVVEHLGKPDLYNTKPPFAIWMQALSMKCFGINEYSVRLPSALFGLFTLLLVFFFCIRNFEDVFTGFLSAMVLVTSQGFVTNHVTRTGDLDSILVFFLTLGLLTFIELMVLKPKNPNYHLVVLATSLVLGFLTKGIAGLLMIPAMIVILFFNKNYLLLKDKRIYFAGISVAVVCAGYYFIRELIAPGYLKVVLETEIFRINQEVMSWHVHPFDYYYQNLINGQFIPFIYILPFSLLSLFILKSKKLYLQLYLLLSAISYFLLISFPAVKLEWYTAPLIPVLSLIAGITFISILKATMHKIKIVSSAKALPITLTIASVALLYTPYKNILKTTSIPPSYIYPMEYEGLYLTQMNALFPEIKKITVFKIEKNEELYDQILFYKRSYEIERNYQIKISRDSIFENNEIVMVSKPEETEILKRNYITEQLNLQQAGSLHKIVHKNN
ncbi:MAG TPA: glycosyltransferase family 39 protein [Bacteroidia bacterium]|nr:glycosyltransferase family 39 protein [Bacteroidia bacterium]